MDAVSRGILGLTVGCARCHDHKFDPILTKDYYALAGVFASTVAAPRPLADVDKETEQKFMYRFAAAVLPELYGEPDEQRAGQQAGRGGEEVGCSSRKEMVEVRDSMAFLKESHPEMWAYLNNLAQAPRAESAPMPAAAARCCRGSSAAAAAPCPRCRQARGAARPGLPICRSCSRSSMPASGSTAPIPDLTTVDIKPGVPRDMNILPHANVAAPGADRAAPVPDRAFERRHDFQARLRPSGTGRPHLHASARRWPRA